MSIVYFRICGSLKSAKKFGSTNSKSPNLKKVGSANCKPMYELTQLQERREVYYSKNLLGLKICGFAICGIYLRTAHICHQQFKLKPIYGIIRTFLDKICLRFSLKVPQKVNASSL